MSIVTYQESHYVGVLDMYVMTRTLVQNSLYSCSSFSAGLHAYFIPKVFLHGWSDRKKAVHYPW